MSFNSLGTEHRVSTSHFNSRAERWHGQLGVVRQNAWAIRLRGWVAISFGVLVLLWPRPSMMSAAWLFATFAVLDGGLALAAALRHLGDQRLWWGLVLEGIAGVVMGVVVGVWSTLPGKSLVLLIALWAVGTGGFEIAMALRLRQERLLAGTSPVWVALCGLLSGLFALALITVGRSSTEFVPALFGIYAIGFGVLLNTLFGELRRLESVA